jgi:urease accessory protein
MSRRLLRVLASAALFAAPSIALAHPGHADAAAFEGFAAGLAHPIGGLDHVLAMVTVGLLAAHVGGRALWLVPAAFLGMMTLGGALAAAGMPLPGVEAGIAMSVIALGAAASLRRILGAAFAMALAGVFAIFHGVAHGLEMAEGAGFAAYALGFNAATAALHATGVGLGLVGTHSTAVRPALRAVSASIAVVGVGLLAGWI